MRRVRLQYISHQTQEHSYLDGIRMALEGGCRWVQLRMKGEPRPDDDSMALALEAQRLCREHDAVFIIDDDVALVKAIHADGVHLGKRDISIEAARKILGQQYIIGGTANTFDDVKAHYEAGADYIGCGPFRFTTTKKGLSGIPPHSGADAHRGYQHTHRCHWWHNGAGRTRHHADGRKRHSRKRCSAQCRQSHRGNEANGRINKLTKLEISNHNKA